MGSEVLIGIDVGTTAIKALAVSTAGQVLAEASVGTPWRHDGPRADADPQDLADYSLAVCEKVATQASTDGHSPVRGVGVTGMAEAGVLIDGMGRPCAPTLAWFDPRGDAAGLRERIAPADFQRTTGRRLNSKPSIAKILWLHRHVPSSTAAVKHLSVAEWIVSSLGGDMVCEASLASRTGLMEISSRAPWIGASEIVGSLLPDRCIWAGESAGRVRSDLSSTLTGATLTVAGLDHQAAALVLGAAQSGTLFDSMGTAEALLRFVEPMSSDQTQRLTDDDIDVDWSVAPGLQVLLAGRLTGLSLERVAAMLGADDRAKRSALGEAATRTSRDGGPTVIDVSNDAIVLGGITDGVSPALTWRAVVEDLTALTSEALNQMAAVAGPHARSVVAGGWSHNPMVVEAKETQLGDFRTADVDEAGALGAAFLAGVAAGILSRPDSDGVARWTDV